MKKIKLMMLAFLVTASNVLAAGTNYINAANQEVKADNLINAFIGKGVEILQPLGAAFIFLTVLLVGFDVIKNKGDAGKRTGAMSSLLWVAVGAIIMGSALFITGFLWKGTQVDTTGSTNIITGNVGSGVGTPIPPSNNSGNTGMPDPTGM